MTLLSRCFHEFKAMDRQRGHAYFVEGRVALENVSSTWVYATVHGSVDYDVTVDAVDVDLKRLLVVSCECPRFADGVACKHLWATLLAVGRNHPKLFPGHQPLGFVYAQPQRLQSDEEEVELLAEARPPPELGAVEPVRREPVPRREPVSRNLWRQRIDGLREALSTTASRSLERTVPLGKPAPRREAWFRVNLTGSERAGRLVLELWQREQRKDGAMGKLRPLRLDDAEAGKFSDPEDRALLRLFRSTEPRVDSQSALELYRGYYNHGKRKQTQASVPAVLYRIVLPRLAATGRLGLWAPYEDKPRILRWEGEPPWRFVLRMQRQDGESSFTGCLERDGERRDPREARLLLADEGLVLFADTLALLETRGALWLEHLGRNLNVPEDELGAFLEGMWGLPELPPVELPDELQPKEVPGKPRPRLVLRTPQRRSKFLLAELSFLYQDVAVAARDPRPGLYEPRKRRVLLRDPEAEAAFSERLGEHGLKPATPWMAENEGTQDVLQLPSASFGEIVRTLLADGWDVEADGRRLRRAGEFEIRVKSGIDWFELEGGADFDEHRITLPELLKALGKGRQTVRLGDGSDGILPEEWLERYTPLAKLAHEGEGDSVRFLPSQALLLDAFLISAEQIDIDRHFLDLRERLRSFERIEPRSEPRGFRGKLRPYQQEGLGWLRFLEEFRLGGCLADDMGLGKTVQVLALLQLRRAAGRGWERPALIVAPKSVIQNWLDEAERFAPRLETADYTGIGRHEILERLPGLDVIVTTYATMLRDIALLKDCELGYVILDEAQAVKNPTSQTAKACRVLRAEHRLALTGTPVENHIGELWSIFEFLNPGMLGRLPGLQASASSTSPRGTLLSDGEASAPEPDVLDGIGRALKPFILRRTKKEVLSDLPPKTEQTLYCELGAHQSRLYSELREHYRGALKQRIGRYGLGRSKIQVLEALLRLRQAACHPGLVDPKYSETPAAKLVLLLEQLEEILDEGHKALVFSQFTKLLMLVRKALDERGIVYEYLDGRTRKRQSRIERFQNDPDCPVFLISLKAGGVGLNLTAADYVYLLDPWWNPAVEAQAIDRAHRIGQARPVNAYRLIARDTLEEKILELQASKRELAEAILTADGSLIRDLTSEDLELLLS